MKVPAWYTYATEVLAYSNPAYKFICGIVKQDTAKKLLKATENGGFLLMPKHTIRHSPKIFKSSIRNLYEKSLSLIEEVSSEEDYTTRRHICDYWCKIQRVYNLDFSKKNDRKFIELISPMYPWTYEHVYEYLTGKNPEIPETVGLGAVIVLKLFRLEQRQEVEFKQAHRDSSQVKSLDLPSDPSTYISNAIYEEAEFSRLFNLIDWIYRETHNLN